MLPMLTAIRTVHVQDRHVIDAATAPWHAIHETGVNLLIRQRKLPTFVMEALSASQLATMSVHETVSADTGENDWLKPLVNSGVDFTAADWLARDITALIQTFAEVCDRKRVQVHLQILDDDECRLFHVDRNHLRLLCTYSGPGTEWLANDQVDRSALGQGDNRKILKYGQAHKVATGAVLLLKGERYPGNFGNGIVHRSPPVRLHGLRRLRLRLDLPDFRGC